MLEIRYLRKALADIEYIYYHYAIEREVPFVADNILNTIKLKIKTTLANNPNIGRSLDHVDQGLRAYLVSPSHWVFYKINGEHIDIWRILASKAYSSDDII